VEPVPFFARLFLAWVVYFKVIFDGAFAAKVSALSSGRALPSADKDEPKALPVKADDEPEPKPEAKKSEAKPEPKPEPKQPEAPKEPDLSPALQLLALLQREGRLVDFLEEDIAGAADADIGAAARVVHDGCRKALRDHVELAPLRSEEEGAKVTLDEGFDPKEIKLTGNVAGKAPYTGSLRHKGWRAKKISLPTAVSGHDATILAQAELEL
jgi:hypothetical protein